MLVAVLLWAGIIGAGVLGWFVWDIPNPSDVLVSERRAPGITILASDGTVLAKRGDLYGAVIRLDDLPPFLPNALLATEDRRFFDHPGIDVLGILRALVTNIQAGAIRQGGSTLTQQLAKNLFLSRERTLRRKIQEALLSFWLEAQYGKDRILELYLNRVYLGAGAYGMDAAARRYFGRSAADISLWQAAVLAGLPKAPSALNPFRAPERAAERGREVLDDMVRAGFLSKAEAQAAKQPRVQTIATDLAGTQTAWAAEWAMDRGADLLGGVGGDTIVETTLRSSTQRALEFASESVLPKARQQGVSQVAAIALEPDGAVVAMLGGADRKGSSFNRVVHGTRQPGSLFKLFVYLAGFEAGLTPESKIDTRQAPIRGWTPRNSGASTEDIVTLREAVAKSINTAAVAVSESAGRRSVIDVARRLGITAPLAADPAIALGVHAVSPLEIAGAFTSVANGGFAAPPYIVRRIRDASTGDVLYERSRQTGAQLLEERIVEMARDVLGAAVAWGTGKRAGLPNVRAFGKTGTTQDYRDAWFAGSASNLTGVVWMGNDDGTPMDRVFGGSFPADLWAVFMNQALSDPTSTPLVVETGS